jgi:hypothetical protein
MSTGNGKYYDEIIPIEKELGELFGKRSGDLTSEQFTAYNNWAYANSFVSRNIPKDSPRLRDAYNACLKVLTTLSPMEKIAASPRNQYIHYLDLMNKILLKLLSDPNNRNLIIEFEDIYEALFNLFDVDKSAFTPEELKSIEQLIHALNNVTEIDYNTAFSLYMLTIDVFNTLGINLLAGTPRGLTPLGSSHGWIYKNGKINFNELLRRYSALQERLRQQLSGISSKTVSPTAFLLIQFKVTQASQVGDSVSNIVSSICQMISNAIRNYKGG